jgi:hypothetical protein
MQGKDTAVDVPHALQTGIGLPLVPAEREVFRSCGFTDDQHENGRATHVAGRGPLRIPPHRDDFRRCAMRLRITPGRVQRVQRIELVAQASVVTDLRCEAGAEQRQQRRSHEAVREHEDHAPGKGCANG